MNKVYKTIWNNSLGAWVVTSELGRGKIKSATSKALAGIALTTLLSTQAIATPCDPGTLTCDLGSTWGAAANNNQNGTAVISDGNSYAISGVSSWGAGQSTYLALRDIQTIIDRGYAVYQGGVAVTTVPKADRMIVSPGLTESILVFDPITSSNTSVLVYHSASFTDKDTYDLGASGAFMRQGATPYVDTRLANISHGVANISLDNDSYAIGEMRESSFVYVDGTTANHAQANWDSQQLLSVMSPADWSKSSSLTNFNAVKDTFVGSLAAFDGSQHTITSLDSYKAYNDWLISQLKTGDLRYSQYQTELNKAYNRVTTVYQYSNLPEGSSPSSYGENYAYWLHAKGENATVTVASGGKLNVSVGSSTTFNTVRLEDKAIGINNGEILSTANLAYILSGGRFTNNGLMSLGGGVVIGAYGAAPVIVSGTGSSFINNTGGVYNVSPRHYYTNKGSNGAVFGVSVYAGGSAENKGTINAGYWQDNIPEQVTGLVYVARAYTNSSFVNAESGQINLGYAQDGINLAYLSSGSAGIVSDIGARGENQGTITLSSIADGVYGMYGLNGTTSLLNNGTINVNSNGDDGRFVPSQSIGIYSISQTLGSVNNTNTINLNGLNNIGIKAFAGGKATSSGTINVAGGIDATTGLRNYGVWSETINSLVDISGSVNLKGDGAIGVHARSGGTISLSGNGQVNFSDGENQIGYFVYGAGSKINNTSSGTQDVTTKNSTLMRLDGGATFAGSSGATSTMSASGDNANVIVATGTDTRVDSGGMTVNVNGKNATGFLIEGGATGNIGSTATIKLSGEGAIAGIADGQGHDLTGAEKIMTEAEKKATSLTAGANLNSSLNGVVGYIARNLATLTNSGNIVFSGDNTTGIQVEEGAVGVNSGNITLDGQGSVGLKASASTLETQLSSTGNLTLNGNWNGADDATRTTGVLADGSQVAVTIGDGVSAAAVNLNGAGTVGVHATAGSTVTLNDKVAVNFDSNNSDQIAFWVDGNGSQIITDAGTTETQVNGDGATLFYVTDTATLGGALNLKLSGKAGSDKITSGIRVSGAGSLATLATGSQLTIGTNATGVLAENAGKAVIENGAAFNISGDKAIVGKASGEHSLVENKATVTSGDGSSGSTAFLAENGGEIDNQGTINLSLGADHTAISLNNGHLVNSGNIQANGTAIHIKGSDSTITNAKTIEAVNGKAAIHVDAGAGLNLSAASGTGTIKAGGTADGILLSQGALSLNVANTVIEMSDAGASGIGIHNVAGIEGIKLDNTKIQLGGTGIGIKTGASLAKTNSGNINVTDGIGILYLNEDGSAVASDIDFSDSKKLVIDVSGQGVGVKATLDGNNRTVNTGVSVNVESLSGGSAIDVSGAKTVANTGELVSKSTVANGSVLNVHDAETISNSGTITASSADIAAIAMSNAGNKTFTNTGDITGLLDFATGDNLINLTGGTLSGNIKASGGPIP
ncbi:ESPR domain-containing protein [Budvicia aquatica]|uniref:ESPR domain-containing protein n=1 Tax=Budvicia aquatica TaxID=82979 RepID=A0A484ZHM5_9GAMM|nr:ESPR domain-containing protein [Budvicia aquatica]VFS47645.1 Uncharacterised protein [Budvicia aquatica]